MAGIFSMGKLAKQNQWWGTRRNILKDAKILNLQRQKYQWKPRLKKYLQLGKDCIYTIRGPRQVGKTTLIKIIIKDLLLKENVKPENIFFWSAEKLKDRQELSDVIETFLDSRIMYNNERKYIFIDEICSIDQWSKIILYLSNMGYLSNCSLVLTSSHSIDLKDSIELLPGRRGGYSNIPLDKILLPMKFSEFVTLFYPEIQYVLQEAEYVNHKKNKIIFDLFENKINNTVIKLSFSRKLLDGLFDIYLQIGGFPSCINEYGKTGIISETTFNEYLAGLLGNLKRYKYKETSSKRLIRTILKTVSSPVSFAGISKSSDLDSSMTAERYISAFEDLYIANRIYNWDFSKGIIYKKNKKIYVKDPFIFHLLNGWSNNKTSYYESSKENLYNTEYKSKLVEAVVQDHLTRFAYNLNPRDFFDPKESVCYFKTKKGKEIDFVVLFDDKNYPFEVKYQSKISNSDFFIFKSFKKGVLLTKDDGPAVYHNYVKIPISVFLMFV